VSSGVATVVGSGFEGSAGIYAQENLTIPKGGNCQGKVELLGKLVWWGLVLRGQPDFIPKTNQPTPRGQPQFIPSQTQPNPKGRAMIGSWG
jgi:hypothetical protein